MMTTEALGAGFGLTAQSQVIFIAAIHDCLQVGVKTGKRREKRQKIHRIETKNPFALPLTALAGNRLGARHLRQS
jgi:hypothetical protein